MIEKALLISDVHIPMHDKELLELVVFKFGKDLKPDIIFLNGDIIDNYSVSRYPKNPRITHTFHEEVTCTKEFLTNLRKAFPRTRIVMVKGNHSHRFDSYLAERMPELYPFVTLQDLLGLRELGIEWVGDDKKESWYNYHGLYVGHYDACSGKSGQTAMKLLEKYGVSVVQGHVHRVAQVAKRLMEKTIYGTEMGCLADLKQVDYARHPDWQNGFCLNFYDTISREHFTHPIAIKNKSFYWNGKVWSTKG